MGRTRPGAAPIAEGGAPPPSSPSPSLTPQLVQLPQLPGLRPELRALIDAQRGPIPAPVRAEPFGVERMRQHGISLAHAQSVDTGRLRGWRLLRSRSGWGGFVPRIEANLRGIERARAYLEASDVEQGGLRPAAEWLLDNFHLLEAQVPEIRNGLPRGYYARLPKLSAPPLQGLPRVYGIVWAYVAHTDSSFDPALLCHLLDAYQQVDVLTLGELWALPTTLRIVLLENLARLAESAACHQAAQELADVCCDAAGATSLGQLTAVHAWLEERALGVVFLAQMIARLRGGGDVNSATWAAWLLERAPDADSVLVASHELLAADNVSVRNAVSALHAINNLTWRPLVESVSPVHAVLRQVPAFVLDSELTQNQSTHAIEQLARRLRRSETDVAQRVQQLAATAAAQLPPGADAACDARAGAAYWLIGHGRAELAISLGGSARVVDSALLRSLRRARGMLYAFALIGGTLLLLGMVSIGLNWPHLVSLATIGLASLAAFECVVSVVDRTLAELVRVHRLPRVALDDGLGAEHRTLIVVPSLLTSAAGALELARQLEQHHLANTEAHARFALLTDWADAPERRTPSDSGLLQVARDAVDALNLKHPVAPGQAPRFALLHRERTWNEGERAWIGWERKRGKIEQLITALAADGPQTASPFVDLGDTSILGSGVRYAVTLDSDTDMPPGTLRQMVAIAAHPLNRPCIDPDTKRVISGYGILQPALAAPLPAPDEVTAFGFLFSGPWGFDTYSAGSSEVFQDVFGQSRFSGKGLLDVQAIDQSLRGRVPENRLLSHDLYEGIWARAAHLSDVRLLESAPMLPEVADSRLHRWTRGDWQLLPLLGGTLRGRVGTLNLWTIVDNLRRSLLAPASLLFLWLSLATGTFSPQVAIGLTAAAFGLGPLLGALTALLPPRRDLALRHFLREGALDVLRALGGTLWHMATLPQSAARESDAIVRTLWRMAVSRRRLLEWTTAAQALAKASSSRGLAGFWRRHWPVTLLSVGWMATAAAWPGARLSWVLALGTVWALTPLWLWAGSQPLRRRDPDSVLSPEAEQELRALARDTWSLFETIVTAADHHLPPDNLQLDPSPMLARRTSPTNIGLYLASCVGAHRLGFIDATQLCERLEGTLGAMHRLPRWHGHFDNWIDTETLQPLQPRYVSTVDSGNLAAGLWAVAQACRETAAPDALQLRLSALALQFDALVAEMDFGPLYDRERRLFRIGFRQDHGCLDTAFYDLLASESRMASYVAIAKGDVPIDHWSVLGRPFLGIGDEPVLRSWSGSMFEYLMPTLLMDEPVGSLLQRVNGTAVKAQREFAAARGVPWGVSESAYFEQDHTLAFQYGPFGVPRLAMRRTPIDDLVIAPYATLLALMIDRPAALDNLRALEAAGARDRHGFIEALDYTAKRRGTEAPMSVPGGDPGVVLESSRRPHAGTDAIAATGSTLAAHPTGSAHAPQRVATFMAHHHGMSLLSLTHALSADGPQGWFGRAPIARAFQTLLHERMPRAIVFQSRAIPKPPRSDATQPGPAGPRLIDPAAWAAGTCPTALIGNGRYGVSLRANGAGQSVWRGNAITRVREDLLRDAHGHWLLLRRSADAAFHSITQFPLPAPATRYGTRFFSDHVEFEAVAPDWSSTMSVWVSSEDDVELRRITLHNRSDDAVDFELMSYFEAVLAPQPADESHPAFSNLFIQARVVDSSCLMFERRPRRDDEQRVFAAHFLASCDTVPDAVALACDRAQVLPRRGRMAQLRPGTEGRPVGPIETGLDPVASMTVRLTMPAHTRCCLTFATAAAADAARVRSIVDEYRQEIHVKRSLLKSETLARVRQRELQVNAATQQLVPDLTTRLLTTPLEPRPAPQTALDRRLLWRFGISGDRPIVLVRINITRGLRAVRALLVAQRLWQFSGVVADLVIVNGEPPSYQMPLQHLLRDALDVAGIDADTSAERGRTWLLRSAEIAPAEWDALRAFARAECIADGRPIEQLLAPAAPVTVTHPGGGGVLLAGRSTDAWLQPSRSLPPAGFSADGRTFAFDIDAGHPTPRPWANVMANPQFGCVLTESGGGFTWALNSRLNQLTPWSNDPLLDPAGEHFMLLDDATGSVFGLLPTLDQGGSGGSGAGASGWRIAHRAGMSDFSQQRAGLEVDTRVMVHPQESAKLLRVRIHNSGGAPRRIRLLGMVEWILGAQRADRLTLQTEYAAAERAVLARQRNGGAGFGEGCAFLMFIGDGDGDGDGAAADAEAGVGMRGSAGTTRAPASLQWTCARHEFHDRQGRLHWPDRLGAVQGFGLDPCGALAVAATLQAGDTQEFFWVIGFGAGRDQALELAQRLRQPGHAALVSDQIDVEWDAVLGAITVNTPDPLFDALVNRWLLYQTVSCRLWAKSGFYQVSGATGFRDQLQDTLALVTVRPDLLRAQLLLNASHQFDAGDVQHWWHEPGGAGVRTHFSDDLLWLPYAITHYLDATGEQAVLDELRPFIEGSEVPPGAEDVYEVPTPTAHTATLYEHAARAIDRSLRFGSHGLPLMGGGDWNDGMNRVGNQGRGESVWLGWFLLVILRDWIGRASQRGDADRAARWAGARDALGPAMSEHGWDGAWYRRAYFDNGHPLGSSQNEECRIDLIAQAWSVFASPPGDTRARTAMQSVDDLLADRRVNVLRLLDPPLQHAPDDAGYIQAYPPGVRENGGQYAHAAVWGVMAQAQLGNAASAWDYFCMVSPAHRTSTPEAGCRYGIEPYVTAGDTYSAPPYAGRGGWSWYTGSAAWLYRAAVESLLGLCLRHDRICLRPVLPPHWPEARLTVRLQQRSIAVHLLRATAAGGGADGPDDPDGTDHAAAASVDSDVITLEVGQWLALASLPAAARLRVWLPPPVS